MENLIDAMKGFPCLWDTTSVYYKDSEMRDAAWAQVRELTDMPCVREVKIRWKKLRDSYRDALKRAENASKDNPRQNQWKYQNQMSFLQPHMSNRTRKTVKVEKNLTSNGAEYSDASDQESNHSFKRRRLESTSDKVQKRIESEPAPIIPEVLYDERPKLADPMDIFFMAMCQSTKRLPYLTQLKIKRLIFEAVTGAEESFALEQQQYANNMWAQNDTQSSSSKSSKSDDEDGKD